MLCRSLLSCNALGLNRIPGNAVPQLSIYRSHNVHTEQWPSVIQNSKLNNDHADLQAKHTYICLSHPTDLNDITHILLDVILRLLYKHTPLARASLTLLCWRLCDILQLGDSPSPWPPHFGNLYSVK